MLTFKMINMDRKVASKRLGELTGIKPVYTRIPRYAYEIGAYTIERDCTLTVEEEAASKTVLQTLMDEGWIEQKKLDSLGNEEPAVESPAEEPAEEQQEEPAEVLVEEVAEEPVPEDEPEEDETAEDAESTDADDGTDLSMEFSLPMNQHTGTSLRNLLNLLYSRSSLIGKATGGEFSVAEGLIEALKDDHCTYSIPNFMETVEKYEQEHGPAIEGLRFDGDKVTFTGFKTAPDVDRYRAYGQLAVLMNQQAIQQKRILAKDVDETNERYAMRTWMIRLGMNGDDFKDARKYFMENLSGSMAFRTKDQEERAKEKLARQRAEIREAKQAAAEV